MQTDTTFEFQWVVHYEGVPSSESQYLETSVCVLDNSYATPLDILRRISVSSLRTGPDLNIDDPNMEVLAGMLTPVQLEDGSYDYELVGGLLQGGFFTKAKNALHGMQEGIKRHHKVADKIIDFTPAVAKHIINKIPGAKIIAEPVSKGIHHLIKKHRDKKDRKHADNVQGYDISQMQRANNAISEQAEMFKY